VKDDDDFTKRIAQDAKLWWMSGDNNSDIAVVCDFSTAIHKRNAPAQEV